MKNWQRRRTGWSDIQNAKFIALIDGRGNFIIVAGFDHDNRCRFICGTEIALSLYLTRMNGSNYKYPLQKWSGTKYAIYKQGVCEGFSGIFIRSISSFASKGKPVSNGLEVAVATMYLRQNFTETKDVTVSLRKSLTASGIWEFFHNHARAFIATNRSKNELLLFDRIYSTELPRDCFVNVYAVGAIACGINPHRDHVSFCTVVLCLLGNNEGNLQLRLETNEIVSIPMVSNDFIVFARIEHSVEVSTREHKRITINAFF